jgi:hypothetical protein
MFNFILRHPAIWQYEHIRDLIIFISQDINPLHGKVQTRARLSTIEIQILNYNNCWTVWKSKLAGSGSNFKLNKYNEDMVGFIKFWRNMVTHIGELGRKDPAFMVILILY